VLRLAPLVAALLASHSPVVAGPTSSGATLSAHDGRHGYLCLETIERDGTGEDCGRPGLTLRSFGASTSSSRRGMLVYGTTAPEVAAVEVVFPGGKTLRGPTTAGEAYHGRFAGRLRFFLAETRQRVARFREPLYARLLGSQGEVLAVVPQAYEGERVGPRVTLARGQVGAADWSLIAFQRRALAPLPGDEERLATATCVGINTHRESISRDPFFDHPRAESCTSPDLPDFGLEASSDTGCEPIGNATVGFASADTRRVVAVLGDGRRMRLPLRSLPHRFGGGRVFALAVDKRTAVRRVIAVDSRGHRSVVIKGVAPGVTSCPEFGSSGILFAYNTGPAPPRSGPVTFQVADRGILICPSLVGPPRPGSCTYPPLEDYDGIVLTHQLHGATAVAGVMPAQAVRVVLRLDGDERLPLATSLTGPYTGRYAGRLRFFSVLLPGHRRVEGMRSIDDRGRSLVVRPGPDVQPLDRHPVTLMRLAGGWRLGGSTYTYDEKRLPCLQLTTGAFSTSPLSCGGFSFLRFADYGIAVPCRPREILLWGELPPAARSVTAQTTIGPIPGRVVSLRRRLHVARRAAFVVTIPARARPTALTFEGARKPKVGVRMPPAAEQCGWTDSLFAQL
jgi:hypothetical protein